MRICILLFCERTLNHLAKEHIPLILTLCEPNQDKLENFCTNFDILLNNINDESPLSSIVIGDFNARFSRWWKNDVTNLQGQEFDPLTP